MKNTNLIHISLDPQQKNTIETSDHEMLALITVAFEMSKLDVPYYISRRNNVTNELEYFTSNDWSANCVAINDINDDWHNHLLNWKAVLNEDWQQVDGATEPHEVGHKQKLTQKVNFLPVENVMRIACTSVRNNLMNNKEGHK